jgi:hypothetical protein
VRLAEGHIPWHGDPVVFLSRRKHVCTGMIADSPTRDADARDDRPGGRSARKRALAQHREIQLPSQGVVAGEDHIAAVDGGHVA